MPYTLLDFPLQINTPIPAHTQTHTVRVTHSSSYLPLVHTNPLTHSRACSQKGFHFVSTFKAAQGPLSNITILLSLSLSQRHTQSPFCFKSTPTSSEKVRAARACQTKSFEIDRGTIHFFYPLPLPLPVFVLQFLLLPSMSM